MTDEPQPANLVARSELVLAVAQEIKLRGWTQQKAAEFFGVTQPRISDLVNGRIEKFTVDTLMNWIEKLGKDVCVSVKQGIFSADEKVLFKLYTVGKDNSRVLAEISRLFQNDLGRYEITEIDVLENPDLAREDRVSATPCLVKIYPLPRVMLVGDFTMNSIRWQLANAELADTENRDLAADLREAKLDERERHVTNRENRAENRERST